MVGRARGRVERQPCWLRDLEGVAFGNSLVNIGLGNGAARASYANMDYVLFIFIVWFPVG